MSGKIRKSRSRRNQTFGARKICALRSVSSSTAQIAAPLGAVAVEQPIRCVTNDTTELPRQIQGVLHAGGNTLATHWAVDVGCIARDQDAARAHSIDHTATDPEFGQPVRLSELCLGGPGALEHQCLDGIGAERPNVPPDW